MRTLAEIEKMAGYLSESRANLKEVLDQLKLETAAIKKQYMPAIRRGAEKVAGWHQRLHNAISEAPDLFTKPKTLIFNGIRVGYMKAKGEITWQDDNRVVDLIKKHFPEDWPTFVKIIEKPMKTALVTLSVADLKKIGVTVQETSDEIVIKPIDSEIDKLINALLRDEELNQAV